MKVNKHPINEYYDADECWREPEGNIKFVLGEKSRHTGSIVKQGRMKDEIHSLVL